tara:strand:+ start:378 stop:581 length:204 start_codon:yes stop_codon:yes gene_type:complete
MRYYFEAVFSSEYFPYWEFSMFMILVLNLSMLWRMHRIEKKVDTYDEMMGYYVELLTDIKNKLNRGM